MKNYNFTKYTKYFLFLTFVFFLSSFMITVKAEEKAIPFTLESETVSFSPEGYTPKAVCADETLASEISYFAIDTSTSSPVSFPLVEVGTYHVFATFSGNSSYEKHESSATITIEPVHAKIITNYSTLAYSKLENPVIYSIEPDFAKEYLEIDIDYFPIDSLDSPPKEKIKAPIDLGIYYTVFNVKSKSNGVVCQNKYMIYEISAYRGKKLSEKERSQSVPSSFKCTFEQVTETYEKDTPRTAKYSLFPASISGKVMYRKAYSNGTFSEYTETPPIEPGDYSCGYFLDAVCIGEGSLFVDKKEAIITLETETREFSPEGISPKAKCDDDNVEIAFTAFEIDDNGNISLNEIPIPIKKCGKYSIIAYPKNTSHYKLTYAYSTIEIFPLTPLITVTETNFIYDGKEKHIGVSVKPAGIPYSVSYFSCENEESKTPLEKAPSKAGKYIAVIEIDNINYKKTSLSAIMYIDSPPTTTEAEKKSPWIYISLGIIFTISFCVCGIFIYNHFIRKKR